MATSTDLRSAIEEIQDVLPPGEESADFDPADIGPEYQRRALDRFAKRLGSMPWWMISSAAHLVLFLLIGLLAVSVPPRPETDIIPPCAYTPPKPRVYQERRRDIFTQESTANRPSDEEIKAPPIVKEQPDEVAQTFSELNPVPGRAGLPDAITEMPLRGTGSVGNMGVGPGGPAGMFGYGRTPGGRKNIIGRFPYGQQTESAVEAALKWLARHQEADGSWDPVKYEAKHGENVRYRVGCTGLALLAFLGHGETEIAGQYRDNVRRAEQWLVKQQKANGGIFEKESGGSSVSAGYNHAIAGLALAEAFGMGGDRAIGAAAQRAVDYSIKVHQESAYSAWRYDPKEAPDLSVTGWFVMQLKSAAMVGLRVDGAGLRGASMFIDKVFDREGHGSYQAGHSPSSSMTSVALVCRQFMGVAPTEPTLAKAAANLLKDLPDWKKAEANTGGGGDKGMYYWYYGTLGMFQMGKDHGWAKWNEALRPVLLDNQRKGGDEDGSWDPQSWIDHYGGRVFTTAMGAMTLEVYYRYPAMYEKK